jgi:release factor H-coupled RctB family protein
VATFRPLVTFKKAQSKVASGGDKREKSWKEDRR